MKKTTEFVLNFIMIILLLILLILSFKFGYKLGYDSGQFDADWDAQTEYFNKGVLYEQDKQFNKKLCEIYAGQFEEMLGGFGCISPKIIEEEPEPKSEGGMAENAPSTFIGNP